MGAVPGVLVAFLAALAASLAASRIGAPAMLAALLAGMCLNPFLARAEIVTPGIRLAADLPLRVGVALLGARVTIGDLAGLGWPTIALALGGVVLTLAGGWAIGRRLGLRSDHAMLSAGAVAICGASAALAISSVLPRHEDSDRNTMLTIVGVATLSTVAMVLYPMLAHALQLGERPAGVFLGASIHDVAQVVGAGFTISPDAAETATIVKLTRVACLAPAVMAIGFLFRHKPARGEAWALPVPLFLLGFLALVAFRHAGLVTANMATVLSTVSQWCLLVSVVALGVKTSLRDLIAPGPRPLIALVLQTLLLGAFALGGVLLLS